MAAPNPHLVLFYDYVDDMLERRAPHRDGHIELINAWRTDGRLAMAGVLGNKPPQGMLVFALSDETEVARFVAADPYLAAGLIKAWRVEPWAVVT